MGVGRDVLGLLIAGIIIWIIVPDPIPLIDDIILIPIVAILVMKFSQDI